ncbi:MAG: hypothetical protein ABIQ04_00420 [Candidatus Saccharimonadales bacterium]
MSEFEHIPTELTTDTDVSLHAGNPDLLDLAEARILLEKTQNDLASEALKTTPHGYIGRLSVIVSEARQYELDSTISDDDYEYTQSNVISLADARRRKQENTIFLDKAA